MIERVIHIVKTDMVIHTAKTEMMRLVVEIESVGKIADAFDKATGSSDGLQPEHVDLNYVHPLNEHHLHEIRVVPSCDPLALVGKFTPVEDSIGLLETMIKKDVVLMGVCPDVVICSVTLIFLFLFTGVITISLLPKSLMKGQNKETPSKIFIINCLCAIQQPLLRHDVASEYVKKLGAMIDNHMRSLVEKEVTAILARCGLSDKMALFQNSNVDSPLAKMEETSPSSLSECLKAFFGLILGSESSLPEFEQMQLPGLRSEASVQVARSLADAYDVIYKAILDPNNGYADPKSLARHPPDQIRTILGI
nr:conserved oligomeric Golgi complex subunit 6 [Tanacetum cinerariifolium]